MSDDKLISFCFSYYSVADGDVPWNKGSSIKDARIDGGPSWTQTETDMEGVDYGICGRQQPVLFTDF